MPSKDWSKETGKTVIYLEGDYPQSAGVVMVPTIEVSDGGERKGPTVLNTSASDSSTERDQFLGQHSPPIPQPYMGAQHHTSISPVTPRRSPDFSGRYV